MTDRLKKHLLNRLKNPERQTRPVQIIHHYFPKPEGEIDDYLDRAAALGMGGFCVNMDDPERGYLCDDSVVWESLALFIDKAFERDLQIWIYDEKAYPSGAAKDLVLKALPDAQVKGLVCGRMDSHGGEGQWERSARYAAAYPVENGILLKSEAVVLPCDDGVIRWDLPAGEWRILTFETREIRYLTENKVPYVDLMRADVAEKFIEVTHDRYLEHLGEERIRKITAFFTDEPGLPVHGCSSYFDETEAVCAWTEEMDLFLPGFGENYADLFYDTDGDFAGSRRQWWQTAARLFGENYFGKIAAWCDAHGTRMTGHLYGEETLSMQIGLNGDLFGLMRYMQMPGVDRLYCDEPRDVTAEKTASSAAHLNGRSMVMSENSFHLENNWWKTPEKATHENRLNSAYYQAQLGVTHAASYFPCPDENRADYEIKAARAGLFASCGTHKTDVLVLIPMTAAYERFAVPDHKYWNVGPCTVAPYQGERIRELESAYGEVLERLEDGHFDFDLIDEAGLAGCRTENGRIFTGYEDFSALVVFDAGTISPETAAKMAELLACGGHITFVGVGNGTGWAAELLREYPVGVNFTHPGGITETISASPVLKMTGDTDGVRVRKAVDRGLALYFIHNRAAYEKCVTVEASGSFTAVSMAMEVTEIASDGAFDLILPQKDAVMLIGRNETESFSTRRNDMKVLFIGNSFTFVNDLPAMLEALSGGEITYGKVLRGGAYLKWYADEAHELGVQVREKAKEAWDAVILQDQSFNPAKDPEDCGNQTKILAELFPGTPVFMYQTWAYRDGSEKLAKTGLTYDQMKEKLYDAYEAAAQAVNGKRVPVGFGFAEVKKNAPHVDLYTEDDYHPSPAGTYLAACLFYEALTGKDCMALPGIDALDEETVKILKTAAKAVVA